jgi:carbon monoxide dehydrogenase subunit G
VIQTEQCVLINAAIGVVWRYAEDMSNWAAIMPGYREYAIIDGNESRWTLKVGVGGLVRTVHVLVLVDRWDGPERVDFSYRLEGDPVQGGGSYTAVPKGPDETEVIVAVRVEGTGPMAPMWEAMGGPLLPKFAASFARQLKAGIEQAAATTAGP